MSTSLVFLHKPFLRQNKKELTNLSYNIFIHNLNYNINKVVLSLKSIKATSSKKNKLKKRLKEMKRRVHAMGCRTR